MKKPEKVVLGYDQGSPQDFVKKLVQDIVETPVSQISINFVKNHPFVSKDYTEIEATTPELAAMLQRLLNGVL